MFINQFVTPSIIALHEFCPSSVKLLCSTEASCTLPSLKPMRVHAPTSVQQR